MKKKRELRTLTPIYYPRGFEKDLLDIILDIEFEEDIYIPFPPLLRSFEEVYLDSLVNIGLVEKRDSKYYITGLHKKRKLPNLLIDEFEYSAPLLRSSGKKYKGFIIPCPWYFIEKLNKENTLLKKDPRTAIDTIPYLINKIVREITSLGLNTVLYVDVDGLLAKSFPDPYPSKPWNWSLLRELLYKSIRYSDAELQGIMFCSKPGNILLNMISEINDISFIVIDAEILSKNPDLINVIHDSINQFAKEPKIAVGITPVTSNIRLELRNFKKIIKSIASSIGYVSISCKAWSILYNNGLNSIRRAIRLTKLLSIL